MCGFLPAEALCQAGLAGEVGRAPPLPSLDVRVGVSSLNTGGFTSEAAWAWALLCGKDCPASLPHCLLGVRRAGRVPRSCPSRAQRRCVTWGLLVVDMQLIEVFVHDLFTFCKVRRDDVGNLSLLIFFLLVSLIKGLSVLVISSMTTCGFVDTLSRPLFVPLISTLISTSSRLLWG